MMNERKIIGEMVPKFSTFEDQSSFAGFVPSDSYVLSLFNLETNRLRPYLDADVKRRGGQLMKMDHSFKFTKHL